MKGLVWHSTIVNMIEDVVSIIFYSRVLEKAGRDDMQHICHSKGM